MHRTILILLALLPAIDQLFTRWIGSYGLGLVLRILILLGVPLVWVIVNRQGIRTLLLPFRGADRRRTVIMSIVGSVGAIVAVGGLYVALSPWIDAGVLQEHIASIYPLTIGVYVLVGLSISIVNPLIEEYFWRGFVFREYDRYGNGLWTGALFALHHAVMLWGWFSLPVYMVAIIGLAIVGILFNWLYRFTGSIWAGLITHAVADIVIVVIGVFVLF